jgi:H/ACA ribonucleoprotein complex subunit 4
MWLVKSEVETNPQFGKYPYERTFDEAVRNSVVIVDKNKGPTSHQISQWIKEIFSLKKVGHAGTLDPFATGVLPVALENAVKAMPALQGLTKEYVGVMRLHAEIAENTLREGMLKFVGKIRQLPPKKSAVARKVREREIYFFDIIETEGRNVLFKAGVEAGTYIRKLVHDLGQALGVGAHLTELRRTRAGNFFENQAHSLVEIRDAYEAAKEGDENAIKKILIPVEYAIAHVKKIFLKDSAINAVAHGSPVFVSGITRIQEGIIRGELVAVYSEKEELVALGIAKLTSEEMFKRKKGVAVRTDRVFISPDVYPKEYLNTKL